MVLAEVALVVALDLGEPVDVVHHQARGARHALLGGVAHPVQALERRAVAQMKARHRVERLEALLGVEQVVRAKAHQQALQSFGHFAKMPGGILEPRQQREPLLALGADGDAHAVLVEPAAEAGDRRQRREAAQVRELALQVLGDLLDQQVAERDPAQPLLAVGDRVEHGAVDVRERPHRRADVEQRLHVRAHAARQGHLDEDDRLVGQLRMEKGEAAAVGFEAPAQVAPAVDRMHRLVLDQLFEHQGGGAPVDALEAQEAAVEPGAQQVHQVQVDGAPVRVRLEPRQQPPAHLDQRGGAAGGHVEPAEQLLARRLDAVLQAQQVLGRRLGLVRRRRAADRLCRRRVLPRQGVVERVALALVQALVRDEGPARERRARIFAAFAQQRVAQRKQVLRRPFDPVVLAAEQPAEKRHRSHAMLKQRPRPSPRRPGAPLPRRRPARGRRGT